MKPASLILMLLFCNQSFAQDVRGSVLDNSGQPLFKVTIALLKAKDSSVKMYGITNVEGAFIISKVDSGRYFITATAAGFNSFYSDIFTIDETDKVVPAITLTTASKNLEEVRVTAKKPIIDVQPDKTVFNVENSINALGSNALELLQKAPGVLVDKDDNISLSGKNGVRIYFDGKPSPLSAQDLAVYLRSLPSADIEAIEIITNPSAKYDAAGSAGILNIRLKKNKSFGTNASVTAGWGVGIFPKYTSSLSMNHRNKTINVFGTYSYNQNRNQSYLNLYRFQSDSIYDQHSATQYNLKAHNIKAGIDWLMNTKHTLGLLVNTNLSNSNLETNSTTPIVAQSGKEVVRTLQANSQSKRDRMNFTGNINYRFAIAKDKFLTADADYGYYNLNGEAYVPNNYISPNGALLSQSVFGNRTPVAISLYSIKADYEQPLYGGKWSTGFKSAHVRTNNIFNFYNYINAKPEYDAKRSNRFNYTEQINAVYTQYQKVIKKWNYQTGLRLEQTVSRGQLTSVNAIADKDTRRNYIDLFLSAGATYQLNTNHTLGGTFSSRIDRPSYQDLNPFENRIDELTYNKGNPFLRPQYTNNFEIKHTYKYTLNTSLSYSHIKDLFASITDTIEGQRNFITQRNLASQKVISLNISYPFSITKWWSVYANAGVNYNQYKAVFEQDKTIDLSTVVANVYQQHTFIINKKWTGELSGFYLSPYVWGGSYQCRSIGSLDIGISKKILSDNGTIKISGSDLFNTMPWTGTSRFGGLVIDAGGGWESRQVKVNFSYRFGNGKVKAARQRGTGLDELNKRVQ